MAKNVCGLWPVASLIFSALAPILCETPVDTASSNAAASENQCQHVKNSFVGLQLGHASVVPTQFIHDPEMEVCYRGSHDSLSRGCCNRRMEKKFHATAEQLYAQSLRQSSSYLRNILSANSLHYQDQFLQMISSAENATESVFRHSFDIPIRDSRSPIESLFLDLQAFLKHQDVDLHDSLLTFFDELFPVIYHYTLNDPTVVDIDQDYADCLMEIRQDLNPQPFGDAPARLAHRFSKSFGAARAFLDAMTVGMEVVNTTEYLTVDNSCSRAVTRMTYCSQCHGLRGAFPCHNMCMNIMRGCLVHVVNLDSSWNAFVDGLSELTSGMKGVYDLEEALQGFADAVSDAIMYAMNTPRKYISQVIAKCGHPKSTPGGQPPTKRPHSVKVSRLLPPPNAKSDAKLSSKLEMLMRNLVASKGFFAQLPDTICNSDKYAPLDDRQCWNGLSLGSYPEAITDSDLASQVAQNPEVNVRPEAPAALTLLSDKLAHIRKVLNSNVQSEIAQSDSGWNANYDFNYKYQTEGSGAPYRGKDRFPNDDEDVDFSGSGSGAGVAWYPPNERPSYRTDSRKGSNSNPNRNPVNSDFNFDDNHDLAPYVTNGPPRAENNAQRGTASSQMKSHSALFSTFIVICISLWFNN